VWRRAKGAKSNGSRRRRTNGPDLYQGSSHSPGQGAGIARAGDACAGAGFCDKAVEITLDIEQPLYEATTLLNAVSLINRIRKESQN
jgi:hypothetical protein